MTFDFDRLIAPTGDSLKHSFHQQRGKADGLLSMWVADMDFAAPPAVIDAINARAAHGIYGYSDVKEPYYDAVRTWFANRFDYHFSADQIVKTPGVVFAIAAAVRAFSNIGEGVLIQRPVYYPFSSVIRDNGRAIVNNALIDKGGHYEIDFNDFEKKVADPRVKLFLLCSPHNPVGRVYTKSELQTMGELCLKHGVLVISDEIHADFTLPPHTHTVFAGANPAFADNSIICTAPSKTFNLAGLQTANIIVQNPALRKALRKEIDKTGYSQLNPIGLAAAEAAYRHGAAWLDALKSYLSENYRLTDAFLKQNLPAVSLTRAEGTYLAWLNFKKTGLEDVEINRRILEIAKLWLDEGTMFGPEGAGYQRINIACPKTVLQQALTRLKSAF